MLLITCDEHYKFLNSSINLRQSSHLEDIQKFNIENVSFLGERLARQMIVSLYAAVSLGLSLKTHREFDIFTCGQ